MEAIEVREKSIILIQYLEPYFAKFEYDDDNQPKYWLKASSSSNPREKAEQTPQNKIPLPSSSTKQAREPRFDPKRIIETK